MTLEKKIKQILPNATVKVSAEIADNVSANVAEVSANELKSLLRHGLKKIKRSGSGLTLKFN